MIIGAGGVGGAGIASFTAANSYYRARHGPTLTKVCQAVTGIIAGAQGPTETVGQILDRLGWRDDLVELRSTSCSFY